METVGHYWCEMDDAVVGAVLALAPQLHRYVDEPDVAVPGARASSERERAALHERIAASLKKLADAREYAHRAEQRRAGQQSAAVDQAIVDLMLRLSSEYGRGELTRRVAFFRENPRLAEVYNDMSAATKEVYVAGMVE